MSDTGFHLMKIACFISLFLVGACSPFPKDAAGTTERIERTRTLRVAVVAGTEKWGDAKQVTDKLARRYGSTVEVRFGPAAKLLQDLKEGRADIVIGEFGRSAAVSKEASLSDAIGQPEPRDGMLPVLRVARKKGENRLITDSDKLVMK